MFAISENIGYNRITGISERPVEKPARHIIQAPPLNFNTHRNQGAAADSRLKEGRKMNYLAWSMEYINTADEISKVIDKLKKRRKAAPTSVKKELDQKITQYRIYYRECMETAALLRERHRDAA